MNDETKPTGLALLRAPFPPNQISKLPKPFKKDATKGNCSECGGYHGLPAVHLDYVGHAALTDRLLDADPEWNWEPVEMGAAGPVFDKSGGLWIKLTVCGVTRLGYGHAADSSFKDVGSREKEVIGDALRNAAMRFGAALDLWHKGDLHAHNEEEETKLEQPLKELKQQNATTVQASPQPVKQKFEPPASVKQRLDNNPGAQPPLFPSVVVGSSDLGSHIIKVGKKYLGKHLSDIPLQEIPGYVKYFRDGAIKDKKPLDAKTQEFVDVAEAYIKQQLSSTENPSFDPNEDIPF